MNKKPEFDIPIEKRILNAQKELETENKPKITNICMAIEIPLLFSIKQIGLNRRMEGKKPYTLTGIIKEALNNVVKENL